VVNTEFGLGWSILNSDSRYKNFTPYKKFSSIDIWIISRLKRENLVVLTILSEEYARERGISKRSARRVLERHLKALVENGIVERLPSYPVSFSLKKLPIEYFSSKSQDFQTCDCFDLSLNNHNSKTLGNFSVASEKIEELRKIHLRVIRRANAFRQRALLIAQYKHTIRPGSREHSDIAYLYEENIKEWNRSVLVFENDDEEFMISNVRTRFNDEKKALWNYLKSKKALKIAFKKYKNAIMITLTIPHIFPLVYPIKQNGKIIGFIPLQDSILTQLKTLMMAWIRSMWKGRKLETFTAYEYHTDYALHLHVLIFGIPYLIDWSRKYGRKKEDALTYYSRKYQIPLPSDLETKMKDGKLEPEDKTLISKYVFTALLDMWLQKILVRFGSVLHMNLLQAYLDYKRKEKIQGPINEIHRIKDGKWAGKPPRDSVIEYSTGAAYRKVLSPDQYVTKYVTKIFEMIKSGGGGGGIREEDQAKVFGYWLFGKRFNSYSPSLLPKIEKEPKVSVWHFVGVFNILDLPDYVTQNLVTW
jgi:hypothetical protein